jgi:PAS domain S-box-containing protein
MVWVFPRVLSLPSTAQLQAEIQQRKTAEAATQEALYRLQAIASRVPGLVYQYRIRPDGSNYIPYCSAFIRDIFELSPEDVCEDASKIFALTVPDDFDGLMDSIKQSTRDLTPWQHEYRIKLDDGTVHWLLGNSVPEREEDGSTLWHGFITNITERKKMEAELKSSEAKLRLIIEASPVPMALLDEQLNITFLNPAFVKTFGYSLADTPTLAEWRLNAHPDPGYRQWVKASWQNAQGNIGQHFLDIPPVEMAVHCKNNNIKTVLTTGANIYHDSSKMYLMMLYDITKRKQIEAKLDAIFNAAVEGIITFGLSDTILSTNTAVETIFGYKQKELVGCNLNKLMPSLPKVMNVCSLSRAVKPGGQIREIEGVHKNGSLVPLDLSMAEYSIDNVQFFTYIVRDVSERKFREQQDKQHLDQLAHVTRMGLMGEMASGIAHEVNQPLAAIATYAQVSLNLLKKENPDLVKLVEILSKTKEQTLRAGQIIHRMRAFIKSNAKHRSIADLNRLIHDAVGLCIAELKHGDIKLVIEEEDNLPLVCVDQIQIEQVLINLIRNSIDALENLPSSQQRQIIIDCHRTQNNALEVSVKDNGAGLDEEQKQKIIMPFYTTKTEGMGMGLSICRSLIEAHGGILRFDSKLGKGTDFYFTLPIETAKREDEGER